MATTTKKKSAKPKTSKAKTPKKPARSSPENTVSAALVIGERALKDLARLSDQCMNRAAQASGDLGQAIRDAQEKGLDPVAFRMANRLRRLGQRDPIKLRSVLDNWDYYRDVLGLDKMKATDMFLDQNPPKAPRKRKAKGDGATGEDIAQAEAAAGESAAQANDGVVNLDDHREVA